MYGVTLKDSTHSWTIMGSSEKSYAGKYPYEVVYVCPLRHLDMPVGWDKVTKICNST